jgi:hypothetical protein
MRDRTVYAYGAWGVARPLANIHLALATGDMARVDKSVIFDQLFQVSHEAVLSKT